MAFRIVKQLYPAPSSSGAHQDPPWALRNVFVESTGSEGAWSFDNESDANAKAAELSGSDSSGRKYRVEAI